MGTRIFTLDPEVISRVGLLSPVLQTARQSLLLPPLPFRWRLFIPSDKPEDPRGGGLKDLEGPVSLAGAGAPSQAGHGEEVGRLGTAEVGEKDFPPLPLASAPSMHTPHTPS